MPSRIPRRRQLLRGRAGGDQGPALRSSSGPCGLAAGAVLGWWAATTRTSDEAPAFGRIVRFVSSAAQRVRSGLSVYTLPPNQAVSVRSQWKALRTTNALERINEEFDPIMALREE